MFKVTVNIFLVTFFDPIFRIQEIASELAQPIALSDDIGSKKSVNARIAD